MTGYFLPIFTFEKNFFRRLFLQTELIKKLNAQISARDEQIEKMERFLNEKEGEINKLRKKAGAGEEDKQQEQSTSKDPEVFFVFIGVYIEYFFENSDL